MKLFVFTFLAVLLAFISCKESPTENNNVSETSIEILYLAPESETTITSNDTIIATLRYSIADDIQSEFGFSISIKFTSTLEGRTFSIGPNSTIELTERDGDVTLDYPLDLIWNHSDLKHPISCYFYLHKYTSETTSSVLAKTSEINYYE